MSSLSTIESDTEIDFPSDLGWVDGNGETGYIDYATGESDFDNDDDDSLPAIPTDNYMPSIDITPPEIDVDDVPESLAPIDPAQLNDANSSAGFVFGFNSSETQSSDGTNTMSMGVTAAYYGSDGQPVFSYSWNGTGQSTDSSNSDAYGDNPLSAPLDFSNSGDQVFEASTISAANDESDRQNFVAQVVANGGPAFDPGDQTDDWNSYVHDYSALGQDHGAPLEDQVNVTASEDDNPDAEAINMWNGLYGVDTGVSEQAAKIADLSDVAELAHTLGKGSFFLQVGMSVYGVDQHMIDPNSKDAVSPLKAGLDTEFGAIGVWGGPVGLVAAGIYFGVDTFYTYTPQNGGSTGVEEKGWPALYDSMIDSAGGYTGPNTPGTQHLGNGPSQINWGPHPHN